MDFQRYVEGLERRRGRRSPSGPENLVVVPRVDSTNTLVRAIIAEYQEEPQTFHPLLVLALEQTGGRGRQGRGWSSPRGKGVYATRVVALSDPALLQNLPMLMGVGLCKGLSRHLAPISCRLKWPNDLLVEIQGERKKLGGILIEASVQAGKEVLAVAGFGVNVFHEAGDLPETGTSLRLLGRDAAPLEEVTWDLVEGVEAELAHLADPAYAVEGYRTLSVHQPGEPLACRVGESVLEGTFGGFDESGRLLLDSGGRRIPLAAGEVIEP